MKSLFTAIVVGATLLAWTPAADARVTKIVVETVTSPAFGGQSFGAAGQYETLAGRAFGELDPNDPLNAIITDIELAPKVTAVRKAAARAMAEGFLLKADADALIAAAEASNVLNP